MSKALIKKLAVPSACFLASFCIAMQVQYNNLYLQKSDIQYQDKRVKTLDSQQAKVLSQQCKEVVGTLLHNTPLKTKGNKILTFLWDNVELLSFDNNAVKRIMNMSESDVDNIHSCYISLIAEQLYEDYHNLFPLPCIQGTVKYDSLNLFNCSNLEELNQLKYNFLKHVMIFYSIIACYRVHNKEMVHISFWIDTGVFEMMYMNLPGKTRSII